MKRNILLSPDADPSSGAGSSENVGEKIGDDIQLVGDVVAPLVSTLNERFGKAVELAFTLLAKAEPAAYNAIAAWVSGKDLTPEQEAAFGDIEAKLENPDSYLG